MTHRILSVSGFACAVVLGTALCGQSAVAAEPSSGVVVRLDKDSDKTLDWAEVEAGAGKRFDRLNKDADGTLDRKEVQGVIGASQFRTADPDNDGTLSRTEYLALVKKLFSKADADQDGTLDARELSSKVGRSLKRLID
jgi:hypothetical protein